MSLQSRKVAGGTEALRRKFQPESVRLLFIGESPPASGRFFYAGDSGLYRAMRDAFRAVDAGITDDNFLDTFKQSGCYLVDLCPSPVDNLDAQSRRNACRTCEASLSTTVAALQPAMIATLLRSIEENVDRAIRNAGWTGPVLHLPYPGRWIRHRQVFAEAVVPSIRPLLQSRSSEERLSRRE